MDKELFEKLLSGVKEMSGIRAGKCRLVKTTTLAKNEVVEARQNLKMTQLRFVQFLNISIATLRNWEQRHRKPTGAAETLSRVVRKCPKALLDAVHG